MSANQSQFLSERSPNASSDPRVASRTSWAVWKVNRCAKARHPEWEGREHSEEGVGGVHPLSGLVALRDRVASVGGTLEVESPPGAGTRLKAVL